MSQWITDRLPTEADADVYGEVWDCYGELAFWTDIEEHQPWQPTNCPGKYVHLIAAAPDMLEALRMLITAWEDMHEESVAGIREHDLDIMNAAYGAAREAVDKAEGREPCLQS